MTAALRLFDDGEKRKKENWLAEFGTVWLEAYGGLMNFGIAARYLKPLVDLHGKSKVVEHFRHYLSQTDAKYVSVARFAETFGAWNPAEQKAKPNGLSDEQIIERIRRMPPPLNWGPYWLQKLFAERGVDGMSLDEIRMLVQAYRTAQYR